MKYLCLVYQEEKQEVNVPPDVIAQAKQGDDQLLDLLARMAEAVGGTPVRLAPGAKPAYHAAAVLAAGGFAALLDAIAELGRVAGLDEAGSLAIYGALIEQTLGRWISGMTSCP